MAEFAAITGWGKCVPPSVLSNRESRYQCRSCGRVYKLA